MTITYRNTKGSALLYGEVDENFRDLLEDTTLQRVTTNGATSDKSITVAGITTSSLAVANSSIPATIDSVGSPGEIRWNETHVYICIGTNAWRRAALSTWV